MNEQDPKPNPETTRADEASGGFFKRIFTKIDESMKVKADAKAQNSCCGGKDSKGNKCC